MINDDEMVHTRNAQNALNVIGISMMSMRSPFTSSLHSEHVSRWDVGWVSGTRPFNHLSLLELHSAAQWERSANTNTFLMPTTNMPQFSFSPLTRRRIALSVSTSHRDSQWMMIKKHSLRSAHILVNFIAALPPPSVSAKAIFIAEPTTAWHRYDYIDLSVDSNLCSNAIPSLVHMRCICGRTPHTGNIIIYWHNLICDSMIINTIFFALPYICAAKVVVFERARAR